MPEKRTYAPKEHSPLASIEDWEDFVVVRYPEEGKPANAEKDGSSVAFVGRWWLG